MMYWIGVIIIALLPAFLYGWVVLAILEIAKEKGGGWVSLPKLTLIFVTPMVLIIVWAWIIACATIDLEGVVLWSDLPPLPQPLLEAREGILVFLVLGPVGLALLVSMLLREGLERAYRRKQHAKVKRLQKIAASVTRRDFSFLII